VYPHPAPLPNPNDSALMLGNLLYPRDMIRSIQQLAQVISVAASLAPAMAARAADRPPSWASGGIRVAHNSFTKASRVPEDCVP
jgi:hypothetical protein